MSQSPKDDARDRSRAFPGRFLRSLGTTGRHLLFTVPGAIKGFSRHYCTQLAAAISYHVLFSIVPLFAVVASILALLLQNQELQDEFVEKLLAEIPVSVEGEEDIKGIVSGAATPVSAVGLIGLVGLLWAASGMMASLRAGLDAAWNVPKRHPYLLGKFVDFALVFFIGFLLIVSVVMTTITQVLTQTTDELADAFAFLEPVSAAVAWMLAIVFPFLLTFATFATLYRLVPSTRPRMREVIPGALIAAVAFDLLTHGFAIYLAYFSNYNALYGALGAIFGFLLFVYLSALVILFGAELAAQWPRVDVRRVEQAVREKLPEGAGRLARTRGLWSELSVAGRD